MAFLEGDPAIAANDEVVEKGDSKQFSCLYCFLGEADIGGTGVGRAAGVDVRQDNAGCVESYGLLEHLCEPDVDAVDGSPVDQRLMGDLMPGVEKECPSFLLIKGIKGRVDVSQEMIGCITGRTNVNLFTDHPRKSADSFGAVIAWPGEGRDVVPD